MLQITNTPKRPKVVTGLALFYFFGALACVLFIFTDFTQVVPLGLDVLFGVIALAQCVLGRGLWKMQNWARVATVVLSIFFAFPCVVGIVLAFRSFNFLNLLANLAFVTLQGMIIAYLLHRETKSSFEVPLTRLELD
jgi:hypothetical protein